MPLAGDAFELVYSAVVERQPGAADEVANGAGNEDLGGSSERADAGADVDCDAADVVAHLLHLAGMESGSDLDAEGFDRVDHGLGAAHRSRRAVKRREKAVACGSDFDASVSLQQGAHQAVMAFQELPPRVVAQFCRSLG
jgi:hypothetical protein